MVLLAALVGCVRPVPVEAAVAPAVAPRTVFLVRHAEKVRDESEDPPLTPEGEARAACVADALAATAPELLIASPYARTRQTLAPLADRLQLEPVVLPAGEIDAWVTRLRALPPGARAVVAAHSNTVPAIVFALGGSLGDLDDKGYIPDDVFDRLVVVTLGADGRAGSVVYLRICNR